MELIMMAKLTCIMLLVTAVLPGTRSQADPALEISSFSFADPDITFVTLQPKTFNIFLELKIETTELLTRTFEFLFNFHDENGVTLTENYQRKEETFLPQSPTLTVFRVTDEDAMTVTLPASTTCNVRYEFCVDVTVVETGETKESCLNETSFRIVCERPLVELDVSDNLAFTKLESESSRHYISFSFIMNMNYVGDYYASYFGTGDKEIFNLIVFTQNDTGFIGNTTLSGETYSYTISMNSPAFFSIEESVLIDCNIDIEGDALCVNVTPGRDATFDLNNYEKNTKCTSSIPDNIKCPAMQWYKEPKYLAIIIAMGVIVIFIILVTYVCVRFRKKIRHSRFWVSSKTPEEAYNVIKRRLNVKSFYDKEPYVVDIRKQPTDIENLDNVRIGDGEDPYNHLQRQMEPNRGVNRTSDYETSIKRNEPTGSAELYLSEKPYSASHDYVPISKLPKIGTDNPGFSSTPQPGEMEHPYEDDIHPYEQKLQQETSGGSLTSQHKIQVDIENEKNLRKDSGDATDLSTSSYEQAKSSGGSYVETSLPYDRRKQSVHPLAPEVDYQRDSVGASLNYMQELSDHDRETSDYEQSEENQRGYESRNSIDFLGIPPLPPQDSKEETHSTGIAPLPPQDSKEETHSTEPAPQQPPPPILVSIRPPSKMSKPKKLPPKPKPKPKPKPPTPRPSLEDNSIPEPVKLPKPVSSKPRPSMSHINITGGGSTRMSSEFRRPSLFRTNSSENMVPSSKQHKQMLPEVLQLALKANQMDTGTSKRLSKLMPGHGTLKRTQAEFASAALENFLALVDEIESPKQNEERERVPSAASAHEVPERPKRMAYTRPLSVRRNSTPFLLESSDRKMSRLSNVSEQSYDSYASDIYVNKWNKGWEFDREQLAVDRDSPLGEGQFGKVYRGVASNIAGRPGGTHVAIKELKDGSKIEDKDEFLKELAIHTLIEPHENVIELLGCCIRDEPLCIIIEFMQNGSLLRYLRQQEKKESLAQYLMVRFGHQIALGMQHVANMGIVHRDLAARNILVDDQLICKVSDFGFARDVFGVKTYNKAPEKAPIRWYAPEAILDDTFTSKTDVWSFGILLFEIITMGYLLPYHRDPSSASVRLTIATGGVPPQPSYCNDELYNIMRKCWHREPDDRPTFEELAEMLIQLQGKYQLPREVAECIW